ncbi:MAG TPA: hypothetical protein ENG83_03130 [Nitrospirae bacterium]|nr:hypothetical protein BMS3Abin06_00260 [bacterium BMS3Abin06]HDH11186.1 hypothetical protein [Nitrospirota bacterium]HDZ01287.1 hypothetical protein [Nitrospirota bacterium]
MQISKLTFIAFYLNGVLGSGKYNDIEIDEVKDQIQNRRIFDYLKEKLGTDVDLSLLTDDDKTELIDEWIGLVEAVDEGRKMCVDKNGLCLLVAYLLEGIQKRQSNN